MSVKPHCQAISLMSLSGKLRSKVPTASIRYSLMKFVNVLPVSRLKNDVFEDQLHALHVFGNAVEYRFLQTDRD